MRPKRKEQKMAKQKYIYVLRTCNSDMTSKDGFKWPKRGWVEAPDFHRNYKCGKGLHGLPEGSGNVSYLNLSESAKWLVVRVPVDRDYMHGKGDMTDKCKFRRGYVLYAGDKDGAICKLKKLGCDPSKIIYGQASASGDYGQASASGYRGQASASGDYGQASASGDYGFSLSSYNGVVKSSSRGMFAVMYWDNKANRPRLAVGYVGEKGIKPDTWYKWDGKKFVETEALYGEIANG